MTVEQALWQDVLKRALIDALWTGEEFSENGTRNSAVVHRDQATAWIRSNCEDYRNVCDMAGIDPDFVREAFLAGRIDVDAMKSLEALKRKEAA